MSRSNGGYEVKKIFFLALLSVMVAGAAFAQLRIPPTTISNQDSCQIATNPAATLLLPYFEVDANNADRTTAIDTAFTITNVSNTPIIAHITLWSDWSYPVLDFNVWLTGYDVQGISLYDILNLGRLPATSSDETRGSRSAVSGNVALDSASCVDLPASIPESLRAAIVSGLTGGAYTVGTLSCSKIGNVHANAIGYVTIDTANTCSQTLPNDPDYFTTEILFQNQLTGDYLRLAPSAATGNYAGGNPLVHIQAVPAGGPAGTLTTTSLPATFYQRYQAGANADRRQPLPALFAARYISSPFNTRFPIYREGPYSGTACSGFTANSAIPLTDVVRFDEHENPTTRTNICQVSPCPPGTTPTLPETSAPAISNTSVFPDPSNSGDVGGWVYLNLDNPNVAGDATQNWVIVEMTAEGRYGVDFDATYLANGCYPAYGSTTAVNPNFVIGPQGIEFGNFN